MSGATQTNKCMFMVMVGWLISSRHLQHKPGDLTLIPRTYIKVKELTPQICPLTSTLMP